MKVVLDRLDRAENRASSGVLIGDGDRKSLVLRGHMIWDKFSIFITNDTYEKVTRR